MSKASALKWQFNNLYHYILILVAYEACWEHAECKRKSYSNLKVVSTSDPVLE